MQIYVFIRRVIFVDAEGLSTLWILLRWTVFLRLIGQNTLLVSCRGEQPRHSALLLIRNRAGRKDSTLCFFRVMVFRTYEVWRGGRGTRGRGPGCERSRNATE